MAMVRLRFGHWLPRRLGVDAIVLFPYILFARPRDEVPPSIMRHEFIHVRQVRRKGWLRFYGAYLAEYARGLVRTRSHRKAYFGISFEAEAYRDQSHVQLTPDELAEIAPSHAAHEVPNRHT